MTARLRQCLPVVTDDMRRAYELFDQGLNANAIAREMRRASTWVDEALARVMAERRDQRLAGGGGAR
jgi:hypothetical protein